MRSGLDEVAECAARRSPRAPVKYSASIRFILANLREILGKLFALFALDKVSDGCSELYSLSQVAGHKSHVQRYSAISMICDLRPVACDLGIEIVKSQEPLL